MSRLSFLLGLCLVMGLGCGKSGNSATTTTAPSPTTATSSAQPTAKPKVLPELDDSTSIPGQYIPPHPGPDNKPGTGDEALHFPDGTFVPICTQAQLSSGQVGTPLCYTTNPPTSGPHAVNPMPWGVLTQAAPKENLVHNMEHGGVVVWYNTNNATAIATLVNAVNAFSLSGRNVVLTPYPDLEPETVAITSWTRLDKFPVSALTFERVSTFIQANERRYNPEGF